ncbi:unnamed protein product [Laminaria digitata]
MRNAILSPCCLAVSSRSPLGLLLHVAMPNDILTLPPIETPPPPKRSTGASGVAVLRLFPALGFVGLCVPRGSRANRLGRRQRGRDPHTRHLNHDHLGDHRRDHLRRHSTRGQPDAAHEPGR